MKFPRRLFLILLPLAAAGCMRGEDYVVLPLNHPAAPTAEPGVQLAGSMALDPELRTVRPENEVKRVTSTPVSGGGRQHHRH